MFVFINGCLVFNKNAKLLNGEKIVFSTNGGEANEYPHAKKKTNKNEPNSHTLYKT